MTASAEHPEPSPAAPAPATPGSWDVSKPDHPGRDLASEPDGGHVGAEQLPGPVGPRPDGAVATEAVTVLARAARAQQQAHALAAQSDVLLLQEAARRVAAQVSDQQPFGVPAPPSSRRSPLRHGFGWTSGALLALALGLAARTVAHQLLLVLAAFIAIGLDPAVAFLVRRGLRRGVAVAVITMLALAAVAGFVAARSAALAQQAAELVSQAPKYLQQLNDHSTVLGRLNNQFHLVDKLKAQASGGASLAAGGVLHAGTVLISATFETVIVLVLVIYFLADLAQIKHGFYRLFPRHRRPRVGLLGDAILARVGGYVLGNVLTSIVATIGNYIVLLALHVPYALALSILVGVLDLIPLVGSTVGAVIVALVALAAVSTTAALITVAYHVLYRVFEDYLLNPRVLRRTVDVSPLVTIIAVLIGGSLLGITGALIAVPAAAAIQLLLTEVLYPQRDTATAPT